MSTMSTTMLAKRSVMYQVDDPTLPGTEGDQSVRVDKHRIIEGVHTSMVWRSVWTRSQFVVWKKFSGQLVKGST
ncbi:unnamed protein product [Protopolystoma xenopodis]|uniref:Uncharacterized protein n=1 Tax=Protopolystoma xenopodis TaxID=117903 RepID=A0A3S5B8Z4_9PLAT|nr:unnamed protein product [Protopolystoma xenopodis]